MDERNPGHTTTGRHEKKAHGDDSHEPLAAPAADAIPDRENTGGEKLKHTKSLKRPNAIRRRIARLAAAVLNNQFLGIIAAGTNLVTIAVLYINFQQDSKFIDFERTCAHCKQNIAIAKTTMDTLRLLESRHYNTNDRATYCGIYTTLERQREYMIGICGEVSIFSNNNTFTFAALKADVDKTVKELQIAFQEALALSYTHAGNCPKTGQVFVGPPAPSTSSHLK